MSGPKLAMIWIDGQAHAVEPGRNLLEVALELGYDLPYFCWHPELGSVGACRQCAVTQYRDENDTQGRVIMGCMTPCTDGARFSLKAEEATEMRGAVVELLMTNHPHDCPVCEEGGNCHLQDMTVMTGHREREYRYTKRTHRNQDLGPCVGHEMNRCIACYRCVRFYRDYAGGKDLDNFGAHDQVYFGRAENGTLESPFSGNLVEVCPTGVFTDKPYGADYARKWDLQSAPSVCTHCSIGCNVSPGERYGRIRRVENRYHGELNGYFLCDRGRFGHSFSRAQDRPREPWLRGETLSPQAAAQQLEQIFAAGGVIGIGSPRASLEANYALLARVGADNFYRGESATESAAADAALELLRSPAVEIANLRDVESSTATLVLGEDVRNTGALVELSLRQMVRQKAFEMADDARIPRWQDASVRILAGETRSPLYVATPDATALDEIAAGTLRGSPERLVLFALEVAAALGGYVGGNDPELIAQARKVAADLRAAERPLLVTGTGCRNADLLRGAAQIAGALHAATGRKLRVVAVQSEANSAGTALLGGAALDAALARMAEGSVRAVVVLENDLFRHGAESRIAKALERVPTVVVVDHIDTPTLQRASLRLPSTNVFECDGTLVNFEGRAQRHFAVYRPLEGHLRPAWRWLQAEAERASFDQLNHRMAQTVPALAGVAQEAPEADFRVDGSRVARQPHRYSGRTAMNANLDIHEPRPPQDGDSPLAFSMEGASAVVPKPAALVPMFWAPGWNSGQSLHRFQQEIGGSLRGGDTGVQLLARGSATSSTNVTLPTGADAGLPLLPLYRLFGSEELSARAPAIRERGTASNQAVLHPDTAARLGVSAGQRLELRLDDTRCSLELRLDAGIAVNGIGLPAELIAGCSTDARVEIQGVNA